MTDGLLLLPIGTAAKAAQPICSQCNRLGPLGFLANPEHVARIETWAANHVCQETPCP